MRVHICAHACSAHMRKAHMRKGKTVFSGVLSPSTVGSGHWIQVTRLALPVPLLVEPSHWP